MKLCKQRIIGLLRARWPRWLADLNLRLRIRPWTFRGMVLQQIGRLREPYLIRMVDKVEARNLCTELSPTIKLPKLYQVTANPEELNPALWPEEFVIKPSHGSGALVIVTKRPWPGLRYQIQLDNFEWSNGYWGMLSSSMDLEILKKLSRDWLNSNFEYWKPKIPEWAYGQVSRRLIVEELILESDGSIPMELRFHCINGRVYIGRITETHTPMMMNWTLDRSGNILKASSGNRNEGEAHLAPIPLNWQEAVEEAEKLSKGADYVRIDLYTTQHGIYFSEFTPYPFAGNNDFHPKSLSRRLAKIWRSGSILPLPGEVYPEKTSRESALSFATKKPRILVVNVFDWHEVILNPIKKLLRDWASLEATSLESIRRGWKPRYGPELVVVCDAGAVRFLREKFPESLFLHVGHGLISKNQPEMHYREADYICVASESAVKRFVENDIRPRLDYLITGLIQSDPLFQSSKAPEPIRNLDVTANLLYAPTWNPTLSSAEMFGGDLVSALRGLDDSIGIVIKPHPHIRVVKPEWLELWKRMADLNENVTLCDPESDLIPALLGADVLISDSSSAIFHFLALDRPMILIDNPDRFSDPSSYDPTGIEWTWRRDIADCTEVISEVSKMISEAITFPNRKSEARSNRRTELFGDLIDGKSTERVNEAIKRILLEGAQKWN